MYKFGIRQGVLLRQVVSESFTLSPPTLLNTLALSWVGWGFVRYVPASCSISFNRELELTFAALELWGHLHAAWRMLAFILIHLCSSWRPWVSGENPDELVGIGMWTLREKTGASYVHGTDQWDTWSGLRNPSSLGEGKREGYGCGDWIGSGWKILIPYSVPEPYVQSYFIWLDSLSRIRHVCYGTERDSRLAAPDSFMMAYCRSLGSECVQWWNSGKTLGSEECWSHDGAERVVGGWAANLVGRAERREWGMKWNWKWEVRQLNGWILLKVLRLDSDDHIF